MSLPVPTSRSHRSFWLEECDLSSVDCPPPSQNIQVDIAIIGGGYVGLWTALQLKAAEPGASVAVFEKDICGGGASGRNGGFVLSWWPKISSLVAICGRETAKQIAKDSEDAIGEIDRFFSKHQIDIGFRRSGWLWTATSAVQDKAWDGVLRVCESIQADVFRRLPPEEVGRRAGSPIHRSGIFDPTAAMVQPAHLVRGLRKIALQQGVQIYENAAIRSFTRSRPVHLDLSTGTKVQSDRLVIANNAWAAGIRELARSIVPITSDMIMTEPATELLQTCGWTGGEGITDSQTMVDYYRVDRAGRIAFGKGGWGIAYGGNLGPDFDRNLARARTVEADFRRYYPQMKNLRITHDWSGPIDRTPNSLPLLGRFKKHPNIIYGVGWSGNGVGPSWIGGKILASMALGLKDKWAEYPLIEKSVGKFPPEPIRYIGAHIVRAAVARKEREEIDDRKPPAWSVALAKLAPAGLEDKSSD